MKKILLSILMLATLGVYAQEETGLLTKRRTELSRDYLRPSLTCFYLYDGSTTAKNALATPYEIPANFFHNPVEDSVYVVEFSDDMNCKAIVEDIIAKNKIGNNIMANWFPTYTQGEGYSIERLIERGSFAATDNDILRQKASQRQTVINELGESLIDRSYAVFFFVKEIVSKDKQGTEHHYSNISNALVYKLDFNEEVRNDFYTNHYMSQNGVYACKFPMIFVREVKKKGFPYNLINITVNGEDAKGQTNFNNPMRSVRKKVADFKVKTPVVGTNPVVAKIGTKEDAFVDCLYDAFEYVQKEDGTSRSKYVATVRAKNVADNNTVATGETDKLTDFYYIKGRTIREGMTLVDKRDIGLSIDVKYGLSGLDLSVGYRISKWLPISIPGLILYGNFSVLNSTEGGLLKVYGCNIDRDENGNELNTATWEEVSAAKITGGLAKEFNFARTFVFTPALEFGLWLPWSDPIILSEDGKTAKPAGKDSKDGVSAGGFTFSGMAQIGYMLTKKIQFYGEVGYNFFRLNDEYKWLRDYTEQETGKAPGDPQKIKLGIGARIYF
jgi:hypothetical protein